MRSMAYKVIKIPQLNREERGLVIRFCSHLQEITKGIWVVDKLFNTSTCSVLSLNVKTQMQILCYPYTTLAFYTRLHTFIWLIEIHIAFFFGNLPACITFKFSVMT